jgi:hypothetical protein
MHVVGEAGLAVLDASRDGVACVLALYGVLEVRSIPFLAGELITALLGAGRVLVDLSGVRVGWPPALQVFASALATAGGWPTARLVLFDPPSDVRRELRELRIDDAVPVVDGEDAARARLDRPPARLARYHDLPAEPGSPEHARTLIRTACREWGVDGAADAETVGGELVANAVAHACTACRLLLARSAHGLEVAVRDGGPGTIRRLRLVDPAGHYGRGLLQVAAISTSWGVTGHEDGKTVWAVLGAR